MKKVMVPVLVLVFAVGVSVAFAGSGYGEKGKTEGKGFFQSMANGINCWGWEKLSSKEASSTRESSLRGMKKEPAKRGTEIEVK